MANLEKTESENFHLEGNEHWDVLQGCNLCQCKGVCDIFGMCMELALDLKYPDAKNSTPIKKKIINLYKSHATNEAVIRMEKETGRFLQKMKVKKQVKNATPNLTVFEKACIENIKTQRKTDRIIENAKDFSLFVEWNKKQKSPLPPMTRTQYDFAKFLFENVDNIPLIGNVEIILHHILKYLKDND